MDYSERTCCVFDNGLYTSLAVTLAKSFGRVLYHSPWVAGFPRANWSMPGVGLPGVTRVDHFWDIADDVDLFVFPDIFHGDLQRYLRARGKRVWGSGAGEKLESERGASKRWLRDLGLPVGPHRIVTGTPDLRRHLQLHDDRYVKLSRFRGDMETFRSPSYHLIEPRLDELEHSLGARKYITEFVVEEPIPTQAEIGYDGFTVDGEYPSNALYGIEAKDAGYVGQVVPYAGMPRPIAFVNHRLSPLFRDLQYRGFFSTEIRVADDGTPYLIDPCCRMASPPGELYQYMIQNLADVLWAGAGGELVEPEWAYPWGALLVLTSQWAEQGWQPLEWADEIADNVKLHYHAMIQGENYYVPQQVTMPEIGAVVACGGTKQEAIANVEAIAKQIVGMDVKYNTQALTEAADGMSALGRAA